jgi:hypothetical protein
MAPMRDETPDEGDTDRPRSIDAAGNPDGVGAVAGEDEGSSESNFRRGVYNGILINGAEAFFHSNLVLAPFLAQLGAAPALIGLIPALRLGGWFLPQLFVASRLAHRPLKLPWYRRMSLVRFAAFSLLVLAVFLWPDRPLLLVATTLAMIGVNAVAGGIGGIPFADVTAKVVPHFRLGTFWALRNALGGGLALISGLLLRQILTSDIPFPQSFGLLFLIGTLISGIAYLSFSLIREPAGRPALKQPFRTMVGRIPAVLRQDRSFRRYLRVRFLALTALWAEPLYAVYLLRRLDAPVEAIGWLVILATFSSIVANFAFRRPANRGRNVLVLRVSLLALLTAPLVAVFAPSWQLFLPVFSLSAIGVTGVGIAAWNLLYAIAPEQDRPLYIGTVNSLLSLPGLAPVLAGILVGALGYPILFASAAVLALLAGVFALRLGEVAALDRSALEL